ncbi:MAG: aminoacyl-tRNA hydrolase [Calditrichia bacterium]|nr:aminoacyl-tRNA hydrolase [Calditrichia bacterium]
MLERIFVIGLGNPGKEYEKTRHNIGEIFINYLIDQYKIEMTPGRGRFYFGKKNTTQYEIYLIKTTTYMNLSGDAVRDIVFEFDAKPEELLIVCDDFNLPFENIRLRLSGSDGGQKGLRSIIEALETNKIPRIRIGIANESQFEAVDFVLSEFTEDENKKIAEVLERARKCLNTLMADGPYKAMGIYNKKIEKTAN